jgi:hypothetical protein
LLAKRWKRNGSATKKSGGVVDLRRMKGVMKMNAPGERTRSKTKMKMIHSNSLRIIVTEPRNDEKENPAAGQQERRLVAIAR